MYGTLITNYGYYTMWIRLAIGVVQPIYVGIKHTTNQRANGNSRTTKSAVKISLFLSDHLLKIAYHFKRFYFLSISTLFGSVIAPCAADPTRNAYLASAPDV